jgi:hypothetical protein
MDYPFCLISRYFNEFRTFWKILLEFHADAVYWKRVCPI